MPNNTPMIRIAILLSGRHGRGSNMQAIAEACRDGRINGKVALVIGSHAPAPALARAQELGLAVRVLPAPGRDSPEGIYTDALLSSLRAADTDLVCLAGYMRKLPEAVIAAYPGRIMNIHAALLPAFGGQGMWGQRVHEAALEYGVKVSGCTVHFVDGGYDTGPIILQTPVAVAEDDTPDTLAARVLIAEHQSYPRAIALFARGCLQIEGRRVIVQEPLPGGA